MSAWDEAGSGAKFERRTRRSEGKAFVERGSSHTQCWACENQTYEGSLGRELGATELGDRR